MEGVCEPQTPEGYHGGRRRTWKRKIKTHKPVAHGKAIPYGAGLAADLFVHPK